MGKIDGCGDRQKRGRGKGKRRKRSPAPFSDVNSEGDGRKISLKAAMVRNDLVVGLCLELDFGERIRWR